ncbi:hypothetical protein [Micromonospora chalcea]|uniref:hypothetical protein n=1 Tax=Micromonospora chalcea TaxID=1874 RepID=UPI001CA775D8|nr:hypothetical protein [Micromonospora chalcea]
MGNLGKYELMTTLAKKVGGPSGLLIATLGGGYIIGRITEAGGKKAVKALVTALKKRNMPCATKGQLFRVITDGEDSSGLKLSAGDEYRVLECDGDAILIEVLNYFRQPLLRVQRVLDEDLRLPSRGHRRGPNRRLIPRRNKMSSPRFDGAVVTCCRLAQGWR